MDTSRWLFETDEKCFPTEIQTTGRLLIIFLRGDGVERVSLPKVVIYDSLFRKRYGSLVS